MKQYLLTKESQSLMDIKYPYFDNRIDCLYIKRYYQINDNTFNMISIFNPTEYGINQINERKQDTMNNLKAKLEAKKASAININESNGNASLKDKLSRGKLIANKSAIEKSDMTLNKFAEVESLKDKIETMSIDIVNLQSELVDFSKLALENNAFLATIGKDNKSILNAINSLHGKLASGKVESKTSAIDNSQKVVTRKKESGIISKWYSIEEQNLTDDNYLALYEHYLTYFNHKFDKSKTANKLESFKLFINGINWSNLQSIDTSAREIWQAYRTDTSKMLFAPNSMKLAIDSLKKLGNDFDLIKDSDTKSIDNIQVNSEVKDFNYWSQLLSVDISIIKESIDILKTDDIKDDTTKSLIKEYLQDNSTLSNDMTLDNSIESFIDYMETTNFS